MKRSKILRNEIRWANQDVSPNIGDTKSGGMMFIYTKDTLVQGNRVWWAGANGIGPQYKNEDLRLIGNDLISPQAIKGDFKERNGFRQSGDISRSSLTGRFSGNRVQDAQAAIKLLDGNRQSGFIISSDNTFSEIMGSGTY